MIIDIEAKVELDKYEYDQAMELIREFVEQNKLVTKIELASEDVQRSYGDGVLVGVERIGMRIKVQAIGTGGAKAIVKLLEKLGADEDASVPTYSQLTDWVRAQPKGSRLLVVLSENELRDASSMPKPNENLVYVRGHRALFRELSSGHDAIVVWLSRSIAPDFESRIPQGVSVYREGNSASNPHTPQGQRIRAARRAAKKNLEDVANCIGTTIPQASAIETGRAGLPLSDQQLGKLAALFGVDVETLRGGA